MNEREKRAVKLWVNNTVDNLEDIIENDELTEEEMSALNLTIEVLQKKLNRGNKIMDKVKCPDCDFIGERNKRGWDDEETYGLCPNCGRTLVHESETY